MRVKLTLRDLFWCILLTAAVTAWGIERQRAGELIKTRQQKALFSIRTGSRDWANDLAQARRTTMQQIFRLSDDELVFHLATVIGYEHPASHADFEPCLVEMQRRKLSEQLEEVYRLYMEREPRDWPDNLELLTALRRAQGRSDPLQIELSLAEHGNGELPNPGTVIAATLTNVDSGRKALFFRDGGDYRGGRRDKWRVALIDENGRRVADSNYLSLMGGGVSGLGPLEPGQSLPYPIEFDLRRYVAPPKSGKYRLRAFFHSRHELAEEPDLTGLIVAQSEPISVTVINPHDPKPEWLPSRNRPIVAILVVGAMLFALNRWFAKRMANTGSVGSWNRLKSLVSRDTCWAVVILVVVCGFWWDRKSQDAELARLKPDAEAEWSIRIDAPS